MHLHQHVLIHAAMFEDTTLTPESVEEFTSHQNTQQQYRVHAAKVGVKSSLLFLLLLSLLLQLQKALLS